MLRFTGSSQAAKLAAARSPTSYSAAFLIHRQLVRAPPCAAHSGTTGTYNTAEVGAAVDDREVSSARSATHHLTWRHQQGIGTVNTHEQPRPLTKPEVLSPGRNDDMKTSTRRCTKLRTRTLSLSLSHTHTHTHTHTHIHTHTLTHTHITHTQTDTPSDTDTHRHTQTDKPADTDTHGHTQTQIHSQTRRHIVTHKNVHIHSHTHAEAHAHTIYSNIKKCAAGGWPQVKAACENGADAVYFGTPGVCLCVYVCVRVRVCVSVCVQLHLCLCVGVITPVCPSCLVCSKMT